MLPKLAIIAIAGLATSAVCMGAAAALGGKPLADNLDLSFLGGLPRCETVAGATATSRDIPWDGSDRISLAVRAHAQYSPGNAGMMHVTGDPQALAHLQLHNGHIEMDCNSFWHRDMGSLGITLPGRSFKAFSVAGSGTLLLQKLKQDRLDVAIAGSGSIKADGVVDATQIHIAGSGDADLGQVTSRIAEVRIAGSGNADIAPSDEADIRIAGSGDVNLHSNPRKLETHMAGSGRIHNVGSGI